VSPLVVTVMTRNYPTDSARAFGKVAVLMGGRSAEREISLQSGAAVCQALQRCGVDAEALDVDSTIPRALLDGGFSRAFIALHGRGGEDGVMQGLLESIGMPYTGSGVLGSALSMDKLRSKQLWQSVGLSTPSFVSVTGEAMLKDVVAQLGLPLIVKPMREGSSLGMSKVSRREALPDAWRQARRLDRQVLIEQWIDGSEYTAAILGNKLLPLIRIETVREFYDYAAKYQDDGTRFLCPCGLPSDDEKRLQQLAARAFAVLDCRGWGRVDVIRDQEGRCWLIEANTVPGMTDHSLVPRAARAAGMSFDDLVWRILESSLAGETD